MRRAIPDTPRRLRANIPKVLSFTIPPELIGKHFCSARCSVEASIFLQRLFNAHLLILVRGVGKVIGPKGKTVQMLIDTNALTNIDVQDDGSIQVLSWSTEAVSGYTRKRTYCCDAGGIKF
jgi:hypothetical protein